MYNFELQIKSSVSKNELREFLDDLGALLISIKKSALIQDYFILESDSLSKLKIFIIADSRNFLAKKNLTEYSLSHLKNLELRFNFSHKIKLLSRISTELITAKSSFIETKYFVLNPELIHPIISLNDGNAYSIRDFNKTSIGSNNYENLFWWIKQHDALIKLWYHSYEKFAEMQLQIPTSIHNKNGLELCNTLSKGVNKIIYLKIFRPTYDAEIYENCPLCKQNWKVKTPKLLSQGYLFLCKKCRIIS